ncbi:MAG TPA: histone deacetylase [Gammaproteobacteria bacterium]|nr:histone deacetylase [Gammaproteobacteria bacterium]
MKAHLVYSSQYDLNFPGLNKIHPFDGLKFSKAWKIIAGEFSGEIESLWIRPEQPVSDEVLLKLHSKAYLESLNNSSTIAQVVELHLTKYIPSFILKNRLLKPLKLACAGTLKAAEVALEASEIVMNIGGGYHHAYADHGEGFCFFADAALSILNCREKGLLSESDGVLMVDLDAHRGNGFESIIQDDPAVKNFDMYGFQTYPGLHEGDPDLFPYMIPLKYGMNGVGYLNALKEELPGFLDENSDAKLIFYNAGNDIVDIDPLGGFNVSYDDVVKRDQFVIDQFTKRGIPVVIMSSGGYTEISHKLIAELAKIVIKSAQAGA